MPATQVPDTAVGETPTALWPRLLFPVVLAVVGVTVVSNSIELGLWARLGPGPGFFPLVLGSLLTVLSLMWVAEEVRAHRAPAADELVAPAEPELDIPEEPTEELRPRLVVAIVVSLVLLAVLMPVIGFQLAMLFFLVFHLRVLGKRRWLVTAVISLVGSFGVFILFTRVLAVNLPAASIGFLQALGF